MVGELAESILIINAQLNGQIEAACQRFLQWGKLVDGFLSL